MSDNFIYNVDALKTAIVTQAVKDYLFALKMNDQIQIKSIEKFFYSDYFNDLTDGNYSASDVIKQLRKRDMNDINITQKMKGDVPKS